MEVKVNTTILIDGLEETPLNELSTESNEKNIEDCLKHMLAAYEATMSNEKIQEYEIIQKILERKSNK